LTIQTTAIFIGAAFLTLAVLEQERLAFIVAFGGGLLLFLTFGTGVK